jgi:hypothetical protein
MFVFSLLGHCILVGNPILNAQSVNSTILSDKVGVKITFPKANSTIHAGPLTINGTSSDTEQTDCRVYVDWNDLKPMQNVTAAGINGTNDYSSWKFSYDQNYHFVAQGTNELTSKIICTNNPSGNTTTKFYSINVTGIMSNSSSSSSPAPNVPAGLNQTETNSSGYHTISYQGILPQYDRAVMENDQAYTVKDEGSDDKDDNKAIANGDPNPVLKLNDDTEEEDSTEIVDVPIEDSEEEDNTEIVDVPIEDSEEEDNTEIVDVPIEDSEEEDSTEIVDVPIEDSEEEDSTEIVDVPIEDSEEEDNTEIVDVPIEDSEEEDSTEIEEPDHDIGLRDFSRIHITNPNRENDLEEEPDVVPSQELQEDDKILDSESDYQSETLSGVYSDVKDSIEPNTTEDLNSDVKPVKDKDLKDYKDKKGDDNKKKDKNSEAKEKKFQKKPILKKPSKIIEAIDPFKAS